MLWGNCGWSYGPHMWHGGGMFMILFWVIVVIAIVMVVRYVARTKHRDLASAETPLDILKRRYAKGELTKEEFDRMKEDVKG
jgi:putative membrane protein